MLKTLALAAPVAAFAPADAGLIINRLMINGMTASSGTLQGAKRALPDGTVCSSVDGVLKTHDWLRNCAQPSDRHSMAPQSRIRTLMPGDRARPGHPCLSKRSAKPAKGVDAQGSISVRSLSAPAPRSAAAGMTNFTLPSRAARLLLALLAACLCTAMDQALASGPSIEVVGTAFRAMTADGRALTSPDLIGATIDVADEVGRIFSVRIDSVIKEPSDAEPPIV